MPQIVNKVNLIDSHGPAGGVEQIEVGWWRAAKS